MVNKLYELYKKQPANFKKQVVLSGYLGNPVSYKFSESDLEKAIEVLENAQKNELEEGFQDELFKIVFIMKVIYDNLSEANRIREKNGFLRYSLDTQLQLLIMYEEDQRRLAIESNNERSKDYISGMSHLVARTDSQISPGTKYSIVENTEHQIEMINDVLPYLLFMDQRREKDDEVKEILCHLYDPEFEQFIKASNLGQAYKDVWAAYQYEDYDLKLTETDKLVFLVPDDMRKAKIHYIAGIRREKRQVEHGLKNTMMYRSEAERSQRMMTRIARRFSMECWKSMFAMEQEIYNRCKRFAGVLVKCLKDEIPDYLLSQPFLNGQLGELLELYEFLITMSRIYEEILDNHWVSVKPEHYIYLCPEVDLNVLSENFARLYGKDLKHASDLLQCYIYKCERDKEADLFSTPLVSLSNGHVLFAPHLLQQINMKRKLEHAMLDYKLKRTKLGEIYEKEIRKELGAYTGLEVYPEPIQFRSSLGDTDIDVLAKLDDYLILIEIKHLVTPYDSKRYYEDQKTIKKAAEQLEKRIEVVQKDWDMLRSVTGDFLPEEKIPKEKIIPVICTNIEDFTSLKYKGYPVIDESALLRFFQNPLVTIRSKDQVLSRKRIWEGNRFTANDFCAYLENPPAVGWIEKTIISKPLIYPKMPAAEIALGIPGFEVNEERYQKLLYE